MNGLYSSFAALTVAQCLKHNSDVKLPHLSFKVLVKAQNGGNIAAAIAVVWCRPDSHKGAIGEHVFQALLQQFM